MKQSQQFINTFPEHSSMVMKLGRMKKLKISEIDKSDLIVSVVSQLISFFEQGYQFDCEY